VAEKVRIVQVDSPEHAALIKEQRVVIDMMKEEASANLSAKQFNGLKVDDTVVEKSFCDGRP
jgi:hypothetical protein